MTQHDSTNDFDSYTSRITEAVANSDFDTVCAIDSQLVHSINIELAKKIIWTLKANDFQTFDLFSSFLKTHGDAYKNQKSIFHKIINHNLFSW